MSSEYQEAMCPPAPSADVLVREWTWKTPAMRDMTLAVCRLALARGTREEFSALDLAAHGAAAHGGSGIAGSVFRQLADANVIAPVGVFADGEFLQRRVRNENGNPVGVWRLKERGLALALLRAHGTPQPAPVQAELFGPAEAGTTNSALRAGL